MSADELKAKGNAAFTEKRYQDAIDAFTEAIKVDATNHVFFSNRSASYAGLEDYEHALEDAKKCVSLKPDWGKGYGREGAAFHGMGMLDKAKESYKKGLKVEPGLAMLSNGLAEVEQAIDKMQVDGDGNVGLDGIAKLFQRPDLMEIIARTPALVSSLGDAEFIKTVESIKKNPNLLPSHLGDQRIQQLLQALLVQNNPDVMHKQEEMRFMKRKEEEKRKEEDNRRAEEAKKQKEADEKAKKAAMTEADFEGDPRGLSDWLKDKGNEAYKSKNFDEAITLYTKAMDADKSNVAVLTNRAAVRFEQKKYDECIADCTKAIADGRELRADFKVIARAFERMGNALVKLDRHEEAVKSYSDALVENRTKEVEKKLKECEKAVRDNKAKAYINPELAAAEKEKGNALVKDGKFVEAKAVYDEAIRRNPKDHTLYSNRALCYMKLMEWPSAKQDCDKALEIDPKFVRALERRGNCYIMLKEPTKAMADFHKGLDLDPGNAGCTQGMQKVNQSMYSGQRDEETIANAMKDPEIQQILQDPVINNVLRDLQSNPAAGQAALKDPVIAERIQKLAAAGILSFG
eukprot:CAMPEP_0173391192 /NCGR_PEP_ID=MMETSP1356-20130122/17702_1 /TAXON_ID=77927 ORGANISM="Hemiselmis virescens, Strain PCC157" /NCGR_SAMPLE_ID=MMETSP1356 /ASSEMBLY_ACC=CAM_ASM_000847 /LENGTH=574 /DNA_ID=CAMNT_0014348765 /DNA_START=109 /DNA_END=1833 /DNA_ORIENTATION=-